MADQIDKHTIVNLQEIPSENFPYYDLNEDCIRFAGHNYERYFFSFINIKNIGEKNR